MRRLLPFREALVLKPRLPRLIEPSLLSNQFLASFARSGALAGSGLLSFFKVAHYRLWLIAYRKPELVLQCPFAWCAGWWPVPKIGGGAATGRMLTGSGTGGLVLINDWRRFAGTLAEG